MLLRYLKHSLEKGSVHYGFDEIEIRLEDIDNFDWELTNLENEYGISFPKALKKESKLAIKRKLVDELILELEKVDRWVLVDGKYKVTNESPGTYRLTYEHPINKYLTNLPQGKVQIVCYLEKSLVESDYKAYFAVMASKRKAIPLTIFGKVQQQIDREAGEWQLEISPSAIY